MCYWEIIWRVSYTVYWLHMPTQLACRIKWSTVSVSVSIQFTLLSCFRSVSLGLYNKKTEGYTRTQLHSVSDVVGQDTLKIPAQWHPKKTILNIIHWLPKFNVEYNSKKQTNRNNIFGLYRGFLVSYEKIMHDDVLTLQRVNEFVLYLINIFLNIYVDGLITLCFFVVEASVAFLFSVLSRTYFLASLAAACN